MSLAVKKVNPSLIVSESLSPQFDELLVCLALYEEVENAEDVVRHVRTPPSPDDDVATLHVFLNPHMVGVLKFQTILGPQPRIGESFSAGCPSIQISSLRHVQFALLRALQNEKLGRMRSKSVYTEVLFSLSSSQHVKKCTLSLPCP